MNWCGSTCSQSRLDPGINDAHDPVSYFFPTHKENIQRFEANSWYHFCFTVIDRGYHMTLAFDFVLCRACRLYVQHIVTEKRDIDFAWCLGMVNLFCALSLYTVL